MSRTPKKDPRRKADLAAIHTGKRALGLDDEAYRALIEDLTGKRSAADLTPAERAHVLDRMRDLGFRRPGRAEAPGRRRPTQIDKARALWQELDALGALRDAAPAALHAFCERQTGKSRLEWCTPAELNVVIEGLKSWLARERRRAAKRAQERA